MARRPEVYGKASDYTEVIYVQDGPECQLEARFTPESYFGEDDAAEAVGESVVMAEYKFVRLVRVTLRVEVEPHEENHRAED